MPSWGENVASDSEKRLFLMDLKELSFSELTHFYKSMLHTWRTVMRTERDMDTLEQWTIHTIQANVLSVHTPMVTR